MTGFTMTAATRLRRHTIAMQDSYSIWIVTPPGYPHSAAFSEVAIGLQGGLRELGCHAPIVTERNRIQGKAIILGANLLADLPDIKPPGKSILYNLEQITPGSEWLSPGYLKLLRRHHVWDYSQYNIEQLAMLGIRNVTHCPIGYSEALSRFDPDTQKDIDVLFYGSLNERRNRILADMKNTGLRVESLFGVYGKQRDAVIARSRIVLNIHYYPSKIFEIVRISWLLANRVCVVSEQSPRDSALAAVEDGIILAPYDRLVSTCQEVIEKNAWASVGQRGFEVFSASRQAAHLGNILSRTAA